MDEVIFCRHCREDLSIRNPSSFCDHLDYPYRCKNCKDLVLTYRLKWNKR